MACSRFNTGETEATIFDRISELPDVIIQHIFSFLKPKEAAKTSVLSKSWLRAWSTRPILDFKSKFTPNFGQVVNNTLHNYRQNRIPIQKFRLHVKSPDTYENPDLIFHKWLQMIVPMVVQSDILELNLYTLNYSFVLINGDIKCCNLKKLKLIRVGMNNRTFHNLISSCPLIELLHLEDCTGLTEINVNLPRLESFTCHRDVGVINIGKCISLKSLSLLHSDITDERLRSLLSKSPLLENLRLSYCSMLEKLVISSVYFKHLSLDNCSRLLQMEIDAPNLHLLEYCDSFHQTQTPLLLTSPAGKGISSTKLRCRDKIDSDWFHSLRGFLTKFRKSTVTVAAASYAWLSNERLGVIPLPSEHEVGLLLRI